MKAKIQFELVFHERTRVTARSSGAEFQMAYYNQTHAAMIAKVFLHSYTGANSMQLVTAPLKSMAQGSTLTTSWV